MKKLFETIKQSLDGICLIDKILMAYMGILLVYIAIHLICSTTLKESTSVDTIIRTSASAIFGYFISNNFIRSNSDTESKSEMNIQAQNDITEQEKNTAVNISVYCSKLQIIVVSAIGFIALVLLLISRNYTQTTPEFSATVSQLRDFLSASIGFLVSCGKSK
ncbi:MAG: hypothetical protein E7393_05300 [Ruminococcaceae bacterium]|nr:hypothetical protein [Oscillospiraceae bacterium]